MAGGAGAGGYAQMGTALSGDIIGGIGGLIEAQNYHRPRLPPAVGPELRLRQLAQSQLLGGGQQLLGATALYNQLAPILMGQLPGMHYVPGSTTGTGATDGTGGMGTSNPLASYQQALAASQANVGRQSQLNQLKAQRKALRPGPSPERQALRQQIQILNRTIKANPTAAQLDRQQYMAGTMGAQNPALFDVRQGTPETGPTSDTLASIQKLMNSYNSGPSLTDLYNQHMSGQIAG